MFICESRKIISLESDFEIGVQRNYFYIENTDSLDVFGCNDFLVLSRGEVKNAIR